MRIFEAPYPDPKPVKAFIRTVEGEDRGSGVSLGNAPIPLQHDHFSPDLIVYAVPFVHNLLNVVLKKRREKG